MLKLTVLDQSIATAGRPHGDAIRNTMALARATEAMGYSRFWVSEHHNNATIVGTAPEILMSAIAATTWRIRVGSAGVMLPHYSPYKVPAASISGLAVHRAPTAAPPLRSIRWPTNVRRSSRTTFETCRRG